jgi:hypothetical protein
MVHVLPLLFILALHSGHFDVGKSSAARFLRMWRPQAQLLIDVFLKDFKHFQLVLSLLLYSFCSWNVLATSIKLRP